MDTVEPQSPCCLILPCDWFFYICYTTGIHPQTVLAAE